MEVTFSLFIFNLHEAKCVLITVEVNENVFSGRASYHKVPNDDMLEQENDRMVSTLASKISSLKNVRIFSLISHNIMA